MLRRPMGDRYLYLVVLGTLLVSRVLLDINLQKVVGSQMICVVRD